MAIKSVLFLRVSTQVQTLEQQDDVLRKVALKDYKDNEIIVVKGKESATNLTLDERVTIQALYDTIAEHPTIERVYFFAVDRLVRKATLVNETVKTLASKGIDCYFHTPYALHSLDDKKRLSPLVDMMLYFLGIGAEQETLLRLERVKAKRKIMVEAGQLIVGKPSYGYMKDKKTKTIVINEDEAKWVRYIFSEYCEDKRSLRQISTELMSKGVFKGSASTVYHRVCKIVRDGIYSGQTPEREGCNVYPPIVSPELQNKARELVEKNFNKPKKQHKNIYYGKSIVRSAYSGHIMLPRLSAGKAYTSPFDDDVRYNININAMDSVIWGATKVWYVYEKVKKADIDKDKFKKDIEENNEKIGNIKNILDDLEGEMNRLIRQYVKGNVPENIYEDELKEIKKNQARWQLEISTLESQSSQLQAFIDNTVTSDNFRDFIPDTATDEHRKQIIDSLWDKFEVDRLPNGHYSITPYLKGGIKLQEFYEYFSNGGTTILLHHRANGKIVDIKDKIVKRI